MKYVLLGIILLMSLIYSQNVDQDKMNECLCLCSCAEVGWDCFMVACYYNPAAVDASPNCMDTGLGECVCQGYGCGRAPITSTCTAKCLAQYGPKCETNQLEVDGECVDSDKACVGDRMVYDSQLKTCGCDPGYYMENKKCIEPNREMKNFYYGITTQGIMKYTANYGDTISRTYTIKARDDAKGVSVFKIGRISPQWLAKYVTINPSTVHLNPGETTTITITMQTNKDSFYADQYISYYIQGMDDKYNYVISDGIQTILNDPNIDDDYEQTVQQNDEISNQENLVVPEMPTETSGNVFEDVKRVIRAGAFGTEAAGKMESLVDMYSSDPEGEKNLLTALAIVGLFPEDKLPTAIKSIGPGMTIGTLTKDLAEDYIDSKKEDALKQVVDVTGLLSTNAKEQIFKNLSNVLPKMLQHKYSIEKAQSDFKKEMDLQDKIMHGGDD